MKNISIIFILALLHGNSGTAETFQSNDIKGFKKQKISMHLNKVNRIKQVTKSDGFPVYEGDTSIQFTVNREDAGCSKQKSRDLQCDGRGNRSRQELHFGEMKLKDREHIYEYAIYFDENYQSMKKGAVSVLGQMHTKKYSKKGCHSCCHFWMQDTKYRGENHYSWVSRAANSIDPVIIGKILDLIGKWTHIKLHVLYKLNNTGRVRIYKNNKIIADLKNIKTLADTCDIGYLKLGIYRHRTIDYWTSDWESLQDQTVYYDSIVFRRPKNDEKFIN